MTLDAQLEQADNELTRLLWEAKYQAAQATAWRDSQAKLREAGRTAEANWVAQKLGDAESNLEAVKTKVAAQEQIIDQLRKQRGQKEG